MVSHPITAVVSLLCGMRQAFFPVHDGGAATTFGAPTPDNPDKIELYYQGYRMMVSFLDLAKMHHWCLRDIV